MGYRKILFLFIISALLTGVSVLFSQVKGLSNIDLQSAMQENSLNKFSADKMITSSTTPVGNNINPDYYHVGPGDILIIQNLTSLEPAQAIVISPENTLIIPRLGEINVTGKTLSETRKMILDKIKSGNSGAIAYVVLQQPRSVVITIKGNIENPGTYSFPATYSVSTTIKVASQLNKENSAIAGSQGSNLLTNEYRKSIESEFMEKGIPMSTQSSMRSITIFHKDGTSEYADIEKAKALNTPAFDPYIREGDEIIIPDESVDMPVISISGAVIRPALLAYKQGDKVSLLMKMGYGLKDNADLDNIYLVTPGEERIKLSIDSNLNIIGNDYYLKSGSAIVVGQNKVLKNKEQGVVAVSGNVRLPGAYMIKPRTTRLKEAIEMAGGFTDEAYLPLAYIYRRSLSVEKDTKNPTSEFLRDIQYTDLTMQDTARLSNDIKLKRPIVSCDFVSAFEQNSEIDNVRLEDGDIIVVPSNPNMVYVYGQVNKPGFVAFENNKNMEWYLEKAGGIAAGGKHGRTRIIRGRTKTWVEGDNDVVVYAGDEVYVPRSPDNPPGTDLQTIAVITSMAISAIYVILSLINQFSKK